MADNIKLHRNCNFLETIQDNNICIPPIQRDYVQGLETAEVNEIRKLFVHDLLEVVRGKRNSLKLDFVYGDTNAKGFVPLDGQQRLTTLFLLHWILGVEVSKDGKSCMTYDTRVSSKDFCEALTQRKALNFINESVEKGTKPSVIIKGRHWFSWSWQFDPTVLAMLVMVDALYDELNGETALFEQYRENLKNISFDYLPLEELGMTDELFVKMNARGKELSAFDKMKSTLEEEIQLQMHDNPALKDSEIDHLWRADMDKRWIDLFWNRYALENGVVKDNAVQNVEHRMYVFILRMIALQILESCSNQELRSIATKNLSELKRLLIAYHDNVVDNRSSSYQIDFEKLRNDINLLVHENPCADVYTVLERQNCLSPEGRCYFDLISDDNINLSTLVLVFASVLFLRRKPFVAGNALWSLEFNDWMRFIRNIVNNDNNNDELSHIMHRTMDNIPLLLNDYLQGTDSLNRILGLKGNSYDGLNNASLQEEIEKAELIHNGVLTVGQVRSAENDHYLWGQIRCLLRWSEWENSRFVEYQTRLSAITAYIHEKWDNQMECDKIDILHAALLTNEDLDVDYWNQEFKNRARTQPRKNALYTKTWDKRFGLKRYLRDEENGYGEAIRWIVDKWDRTTFPTVGLYLHNIISTYSTKDWRWCVCQYPSILGISSYRCLYKSNGHTIVPNGNSPYSFSHDPILVYLEYQIRNVFADVIDSISCVRNHSGKIPTNSLSLTVKERNLYVEWDENQEGRYVVNIDKGKEIYDGLREQDTIEKVSGYINDFHNHLVNYASNICTLTTVERDAIKVLYPGLENIVDILLDNNIEFSFDGDADLLGEGDIVMASAGMLLKEKLIAIDPLDEDSKNMFVSSGYKVISKEDFNIDMLKQQ